MQESASAPASSAARANTVMSADVRRELRDDGQARRLAHRGHHLVGHARVAAEGHPALLDVRAGDVDLEAAPRRARRRAMRVTSAYSSTVSPQTLTSTAVSYAGEPRQHVLHEGPHPDALQADRVQQPRGRLDDARGGAAVAGLEVEALGDEPAEAREVEDALVLDAVAEGAGGRDQRVLEAQARRSRPRGSSRGPRRAGAPRDSSSPGQTTTRRVEDRALGAGAAVLRPRLVRGPASQTTQPRQVPTPQPIQGSRLTSRGQARGSRPRAPPRAAWRRGRRRRARTGPGPRVEVRLEGVGDPPALAQAAVLGGRHQRHARAARSGRASCRSRGGAAAVEDASAAPARAGAPR